MLHLLKNVKSKFYYVVEVTDSPCLSIVMAIKVIYFQKGIQRERDSFDAQS